MVGPKIMLVSLLLVVSATAPAVQAARSRLYRTLTGNSELAKQRILSALEQHTQHSTTVVADLIAAANALANEAADETDAELAESTITLINLLGSMSDPAAIEALVKLLDATRMEISMISADALGRNGRREALSALIQQTERPEFASSYAFRFGLLKSIAQIDDPDGVEFLTKVLPTLDGQLAYEVCKHLEKVTLRKFRGDQAKFDTWKEEWQRVKAMSGGCGGEVISPDYGHAIRYDERNYYDIGIHAKRLVFVFDRSSSMVDQGRLQHAKRELIRVIQSLPETTEFTVIPYETTVRYWRKELVDASAEHKSNAVRFINRIHHGHDTNIHGALTQALNLESNVEAVFLVSDGAPTTGRIVAPTEIIRDISRQNRFRHITINTVGISIDGPTEEFMRELAAQNGGEYRAVQ